MKNRTSAFCAVLMLIALGCRKSQAEQSAPVGLSTADSTANASLIEEPTPQQPADDKKSGAPTATDSTPTAVSPTDQMYSIRYRFPPEQKLYWIIENQIRDSGGVPPLLTFSETVQDRRTVLQSVDRVPPGLPSAAPNNEFNNVTWECIRYEVREKGMGKEVTFDSLRDLYPVGALRQLGSVPGSKIRFVVNKQTGGIKDRQVTPAPVSGPPTRKHVSRTAERGSVNPDNVQKLLDDLFMLFLPEAPKKLGDTWTSIRKETLSNFGTLIRTYRFQLKDVKKVSGRRIAIISVEGDVQLENKTPASQPNARAASGKPREMTIERSLCQGSIEFDIDQGQLVKMQLRRDTYLKAEIESKETQKMSLETGTSHTLKAEVFQQPPPKPTIVGGPKAPIEEPEPPPPAPQRPLTTQPVVTTQPQSKPANPQMRRINPRVTTSNPATPRSPAARRSSLSVGGNRLEGPQRATPQKATSQPATPK